ncbi:hypothetical protein BDN70DRAFT_897249 [Pholiota conissans]|uniref:Uncharacterized protein n=1 Tax=Pholiota conissans TaxID=109636 RepID=A0A9P5YWT7_9AGAR|nr:hypothetical protein BDN70DRAFT_897249 [Pholiota conissans]
MSAPRKAPTLPYDIQLEVVKIALDSLFDPEERAKALSDYSFISGAMRVFCQKQIFRLFFTGREHSLNRKHILSNSPHLIAYVKELHISASYRTHISSIDMDVICILTSLDRIMLVVENNLCPWKSLSYCICRTVVDLILTRKITSVFFKGVTHFPISFIALWSSLKSVEVRDANPDGNYLHVEPGSESDDDVEIEKNKKREDVFEDFDRLLLFQEAPKTAPRGCATIKLTNLCLLDSDPMMVSLLLHPDNIPDLSALTLYATKHFNKANVDSNAIIPSDDSSHEGVNSNFFCVHYAPILSDYSRGYPRVFVPDFSKLCSFTADISPPNLRPVFHIIRQASESLVKLDIRERFRQYSELDPFGLDLSLNPLVPCNLPEEISLASLHRLQTLSITITRQSVFQPISPNAMSSWCSLLRTAPYGIRTLELTLDLYYFYTVRDLEWVFALPEDVDDKGNPCPNMFSTLDDIISSRVYFPYLERVQIHVDLPEDSRISGSDDRLAIDVVDDEDIEKMKNWATTVEIHQCLPEDVIFEGNHIYEDIPPDESVLFYGPYSPEYEGSELADVDSEELMRSVVIGSDAPSFRSDESGQTRVRLLLDEDVLASIDYMFKCTRTRFTGTNSFVVTVDNGMYSLDRTV